jgi:hypothetical protein
MKGGWQRRMPFPGAIKVMKDFTFTAGRALANLRLSGFQQTANSQIWQHEKRELPC